MDHYANPSRGTFPWTFPLTQINAHSEGPSKDDGRWSAFEALAQGSAWHSIHRSMMWLRQMAQLSTTMSQAHKATALHFLALAKSSLACLPVNREQPQHKPRSRSLPLATTLGINCKYLGRATICPSQGMPNSIMHESLQNSTHQEDIQTHLNRRTIHFCAPECVWHAVGCGNSCDYQQRSQKCKPDARLHRKPSRKICQSTPSMGLALVAGLSMSPLYQLSS